MEFGHHEGDLAVAARDEGAFAEFLGIFVLQQQSAVAALGPSDTSL